MKIPQRVSADPIDIRGAAKHPVKLVARSKTYIDFDKYPDAEKARWLGEARKVMTKRIDFEKKQKCMKCGKRVIPTCFYTFGGEIYAFCSPKCQTVWIRRVVIK